MDDPRSRAGTILGDYRLDLLLEDGAGTLTWLAEQVSIHRPVVLIELKELTDREEFLANVRAKAAVDQPMVGSVYEAVSTGERCFVVLERLPGSTLADRATAREALQPPVLANLLARLAEVMLKLEVGGIDTLPLTLQTIYLDPHGIVRLANIACAGQREPARSMDDVAVLGKFLKPLVADGLPGASRINTLLAWMRGEGLEQPLSWTEVRDYAVRIEQQLAESPTTPATTAVTRKSKKTTGPIWGVVAVAAAGIAVFLAMRGGKDGPAVALPGPVSVSAGTHPTPDGGEESLASFDLSGHEVTIREYREFLDALKRLPETLQDNYDVEGQPKTKTSHAPLDWDAMLAAARSGGAWEDHPMSLECPVVNVDWWDAGAFCKWKNGRLPTQEEWFAALRTRMENPNTMTPAGWGKISDIPTSDQTPAGLYGMAGSVAEWTQDAATNPANPLGEKSHVIVGGSYRRPRGGALAREWTTDLLQRRPDLGFRIVVQEH